MLVNSDWLPGLPLGSYFRFINLTMSCTGNLTHPLPPGALPAARTGPVLLRAAVAGQ